MTALALAATALVLCAEAQGEPFPTRSGQSGWLDVPSAEVREQASGMIGTEVRYERSYGQRYRFGPSPVSLAVGLGAGLEAGLSLREGGRPGDPRPSPLLFSGVLKLKVLDAAGWRPALAVDVGGDRLSLRPGVFARLVASTGPWGPVRLAAFAGVEVPGFQPFQFGPIGGLAAVLGLPGQTEIVAQAYGGIQGYDLGAALRWRVRPYAGLSLAADWQPAISGWRVSVGVGFYAPPPPRPPAPAPPAPEEAPAEPPKPAAAESRTRFRLRVRGDRLPPVAARHLHFAAEAEGAPEEAGDEPARPQGSMGLKMSLEEMAALQAPKAGPPVAEPKAVHPPTPVEAAGTGEPKKPGIGPVDLGVAQAPVAAEESVLLDFPTPRSTLKPTSRASLSAYAVNAAARSAKVLVWVWVEPGASRVAEAARRAAELKRVLTAGGALAGAAVVAQVSTHRGVQGIQALVGDLTKAGKCPPSLGCAPPPARLRLTAKGADLLGSAHDAVAVQFPSEGAQLRKADLRALEMIALGGATVEVQVWSRTRDDLAGFEHAGRRAAQVAALLVRQGLNEGQLVFEITAQPDTVGAEVLVTSHLGERGGAP